MNVSFGTELKLLEMNAVMKCLFAMLAQLSHFLWYMISINASNKDLRDCRDLHETVTLFVTHAITRGKQKHLSSVSQLVQHFVC